MTHRRTIRRPGKFKKKPYLGLESLICKHQPKNGVGALILTSGKDESPDHPRGY